jgi:hypothetical protein
MSTEIVKIDPAEYGLTHETARNIRDQFQPMLDKMVELEEEFNQVINMDPSDPLTCRTAKDLRARYVKIRTATAAIHKDQKAFYLNGGRFVDGWKNAQIFASQGKEEALLKIEKYLEIQEAERIAKIQEDRAALLSPFLLPGEEIPGNLGNFPDNVWTAYLQGREKQKADYLAAEKAAEEARIAQFKAEQEERERIEAENKALRETIRIKEAQEAAEREKAAREAALAAQEAEERRKGSPEERITKWIESMTLPEIDLQDPRVEEIALKFLAFKKWAKSQVKQQTQPAQ